MNFELPEAFSSNKNMEMKECFGESSYIYFLMTCLEMGFYLASSKVISSDLGIKTITSSYFINTKKYLNRLGRNSPSISLFLVDYFDLIIHGPFGVEPSLHIIQNLLLPLRKFIKVMIIHLVKGLGQLHKLLDGLIASQCFLDRVLSLLNLITFFYL